MFIKKILTKYNFNIKSTLSSDRCTPPPSFLNEEGKPLFYLLRFFGGQHHINFYNVCLILRKKEEKIKGGRREEGGGDIVKGRIYTFLDL